MSESTRSGQLLRYAILGLGGIWIHVHFTFQVLSFFKGKQYLESSFYFPVGKVECKGGGGLL